VVWVQVFVRSIADGKETEINTAFFHLAAFQDHVNGKPYIVTEVAPDENNKSQIVAFHEIEQRRQITDVYAAMVAFRGGAVPWRQDLANECASTTVDAVLRIVKGVGNIKWRPLDLKGVDGFCAYMREDLFRQNCTALNLQWACDCDVDTAFQFIKDPQQRKDWDPLCLEYSVAENLTDKSDLVHYAAKVPSVPKALASCTSCVIGVARCVRGCCPSMVDKCGSRQDFMLLRAWRESADGGKVLAFRSVRHPSFDGVMERGWNPGIAQPSGFVIKRCETGPGITMSYTVVVESELIAAIGGKAGFDNIARRGATSLQLLKGFLSPESTHAK